jgi:hypothetical protein
MSLFFDRVGVLGERCLRGPRAEAAALVDVRRRML